MNIFDAILRHRVGLEKLKNKVARDTIKTFLASYPEVKQLFVDFGPMSNKKTNDLIKEINILIDENYGEIIKNNGNDNVELAKYESRFQSALIAKLTNNKVKTHVISDELAKNIVFNKFTEGELFKNSFNRISTDFKSQIERSVRIAVLNGETGAQASERIKNSYNLKRSQMDSLSRTLIQNAVNQADEETYKSSSLIERVRYNAILDSRTTDICRELNGRTFLVGEGPRPPQHYNCRSYTTVVFDEDEDVIPANYDTWYKLQKDKDGLTSKEKERFSTDETLTLNQLVKQDNKL